MIEKTAHILGKLAKDYEKVMYRGGGHYVTQNNAQRYMELVAQQERQIKELQEGTPDVGH